MEKKECYLVSNIKSHCTGCRTCELICPKKCISMLEDDEGFFYPVVDKNKCIGCNLCIKHCPVINDIFVNDRLKKDNVFGYMTKDEVNLLSASSGGAFVDLCKTFVTNYEKYAIFGVKFDKEMNVVHDYITNIDKIDQFKKSKYVQSNIGDSYNKVKSFLNKKYGVVFSGTPCQIAGLKKYLNKDFDNLLCIDLVCHGVPSQKIFNYYLEYVQRSFSKKIKNVNFREKIIKDGKYRSKNIKFTFNDNDIVCDSNESLYLKGFSNELFYRPSCYQCKFARIERYSDITISDCWGIETVDKSIDFHKGYSCIVVHTIKGENVFKNNKFGLIKKLDLDFIINNNFNYANSRKVNTNRAKFFENLNQDNFDKKIRKYTKESFYRKVFNKLKKVVKK